MDKYTLYTTAEECAEVSQNIMKVLRFGLYTVSPVDNVDNKSKLEEEIGQLQYCLHRLTRELGLNNIVIQDSYDKKLTTWAKWKEYYDR
jgi:NTP pyrophosphatase (non-canonical NTP hydrolase)